MSATDQSPPPPAVPAHTSPTSPAKAVQTGGPQRIDDGPPADATLQEFRVDLRDYLIERFRGDEISRAELNRLLRRFGLPTCEAPIRVHYTVTGHVEFDVAAVDNVDRAAFTVGVDLSEIDMLVDGSDEHDAEVNVYPSTPVGVVLYTVRGHYDVTAPDPGHAATDANSFLYPDLSHLLGVREGTDHLQVTIRTEIR